VKTRNKNENMQIKDILHKTPSIRSLRHRIHCLLMPVDARGSADIIYRMTHIASLRVRHSY